MKGLSKLVAITILKNATTQAAEHTNTEAVVELLMKMNTLKNQNQELESSKERLTTEVTTLSAEVETLWKKNEETIESAKHYEEALEKELSLGKIKADDFVALQVRLVDVSKERDDMQTKVKDFTEEFATVRNDLWNTYELLRLTRNQLEVNEQSLKVALERGAQCTKTTSMALATTATSKDESMQELSQEKNVIDAQRLENFSLTQELMYLKAEMAQVKAQLAASLLDKPILIYTPS